MKFADWIKIKTEGEAARSIEPNQMSLVGDSPMSRSGFRLKGQIPHGEYKPKNFDRYAFKTNEQKVQQYSEKMKSAIFNAVLVGSEALAGFYGNDGIIKALDDYLADLRNSGVKL
jgi:hypothetical protein